MARWILHSHLGEDNPSGGLDAIDRDTPVDFPFNYACPGFIQLTCLPEAVSLQAFFSGCVATGAIYITPPNPLLVSVREVTFRDSCKGIPEAAWDYVVNGKVALVFSVGKNHLFSSPYPKQQSPAT
jgi:hypothetical protein